MLEVSHSSDSVFSFANAWFEGRGLGYSRMNRLIEHEMVVLIEVEVGLEEFVCVTFDLDLSPVASVVSQ